MSDRPATPIERLLLSRERLRVALQGAAADRAAAAATGGAWRDALKQIPGVGAIVDAACDWWNRHPLHGVGSALVVVAKTALQPVAQRHPLGLVLGAAALGAALVWFRPWRAVVRPALWAGLLPMLPSILASATVKAPLQSWLAALAAASGPRDPPA